MKDPVDRFVRAAAQRNAFALLVLQFATLHLVAAGGLVLLTRYQPMSGRDFVILLVTSQAFVLVDNLISMEVARRMWPVVQAWLDGRRDDRSTVDAWLAPATLPFQYVRRMRRYPLELAVIPFCAFVVWKLQLRFHVLPIILLGGCVILACGVIVRNFGIEMTIRPLLEEVAEQLPSDFTVSDHRPAAALAAAGRGAGHQRDHRRGGRGLAARGHRETLSDLGAAVLIAVSVSFTVSLELILLVSRSLLRTLDDLQNATERRAAGDYSDRVPVAATDETGQLAQSFNQMALGVDERERLREAFSAYVDPEVAAPGTARGSGSGVVSASLHR